MPFLDYFRCCCCKKPKIDNTKPTVTQVHEKHHTVVSFDLEGSNELERVISDKKMAGEDRPVKFSQ